MDVCQYFCASDCMSTYVRPIVSLVCELCKFVHQSECTFLSIFKFVRLQALCISNICMSYCFYFIQFFKFLVAKTISFIKIIYHEICNCDIVLNHRNTDNCMLHLQFTNLHCAKSTVHKKQSENNTKLCTFECPMTTWQLTVKKKSIKKQTNRDLNLQKNRGN